MLNEVASNLRVRPSSFFSLAVSRAKNYSNLVAWLLTSAFKVSPLKVLAAMAFSGLHFACQVLGISAIYWLAKLMEKGGVFAMPRFGIELSLSSEPRLFWVVIVFSALCFFGSAAFLYLARTMIFKLEEKRFAFNMYELNLWASQLPDPRAPLASRLLIDYGFGGVSAGCRLSLQTAIFFFNVISSGIGGLGALTFLFYVDAPLILLILASAILGTAFLYPLALRASRFAKHREKTQSAYQRARRNQMSKDAPMVVPTLETFKELAHVQLGIWRNNAEVIFAIEIGKTLILMVVSFYLVTQILAGKQNWAMLVVYLASLRLALVACTQAIRAYASVSRFYPQISRYYLFRKDAERLASAAFGSVGADDILTLAALPNGPEINVSPGERIALLSDDPLRQIRFALIGARGTRSSLPLAVAYTDRPGIEPARAAMVLFDAAKLNAEQRDASDLAKTLPTQAAFVLYREPVDIGSHGETKLLVCEDGEFRRFEIVGTAESEAVIEAFKHRAATGHRRHGGGDLEEMEEDLEGDDL